MAGQGLQARGDECCGPVCVAAPLRDLRPQEIAARSGKRGTVRDPVQEFILGGAREAVDEHVVPLFEIVRPLVAPVARRTGRRVPELLARVLPSDQPQRRHVRLGEGPPQVRRRQQPGEHLGERRLLLRDLTVAAAGPAVLLFPADELGGTRWVNAATPS